MTAHTRVLRWVSCGALLLLLTAGIAAAAEGDSSSAHSSAAPRLRLLDRSPVRVAGSGFAPGELVRVRARAGEARRSRRVQANSRGRFRASFPALSQDPCNQSLSVTATGSAGHRASLKRQQRLCPPALVPPPTGGKPPPPPPVPPDPCNADGRYCPVAL